MNIGYLSYAKLRAALFTVSMLLLASCGGGGSSEPAIDTTPASFSFTEQSEIPLESDSVSSVITVSGINAEASISIDGGEYSVNGGDYTSATAVISNGQQIRVKHTSSADFSTMMTTTLTIGGVSNSFSSTTQDIDTIPASFSFTEQSEIPLESDSVSSVITVSGINAEANISIDGGEYSINGSDYTSAAAMISNGQQIRVRHTSSADFSTMMTTTLTIGGVSGSFSSTTLAIDTTPASFVFTEQPDVELNTNSFSNVIIVSGINAYANISIDGGEYSINGDAYTSTATVISNGQQVRVKHTSSADYNTATTTTLTIGDVSSRFRSTTWAIDTTPASFVFTEQSGVALNSDNLSNVIKVSDINAYANITIDGGEYSIDDGVYTSIAAVISNGQQVRVKHTSSADYNTATTTTLTIGGVSASFISTTWVIDTTPASFVFSEQSDVELNSDNLSNVITVSGINAYANISIDSGEYSIDGGVYSSTATVISNGQQVQVRHTSSADYSTTTTAILTIGGVPSSFTTRTITKLSFVTGCTELYGEDCTNVDDWTATLWQDDLSEVLEEKSFSDDDILRLTEADDKETVNYSVSGTVSVEDNLRTIHAHTFLGVSANQTYTFSTTGLGFPAPEIVPLNSQCETFTLTINDIPAVGEHVSSAVKMYNPNNPHLPVFFERTNLLDTDDSQDYTVTSCDDSVLVILSANKTAYAEFDTANIVDGGNGSVTLLTPSTSPPHNVSIHLGRAGKKGSSILPNLGMNQYIFSPEAAALVTYDYQDRGFCSLISEAIQYCINDARRVNAMAADSTVNLTFADFSITQLDLNINKRQLDVNWSGTETPTSFILNLSYFGSVDGKWINLHHYVTFSATTLSTVIPPLPSPYQSWLENGDIEPSMDFLMLEKKEQFSALSFADMVISEHTVSGAQSLLTSPEAYRNPRQILMLKFPK